MEELPNLNDNTQILYLCSVSGCGYGLNPSTEESSWALNGGGVVGGGGGLGGLIYLDKSIAFVLPHTQYNITMTNLQLNGCILKLSCKDGRESTNIPM